MGPDCVVELVALLLAGRACACHMIPGRGPPHAHDLTRPNAPLPRTVWPRRSMPASNACILVSVERLEVTYSYWDGSGHRREIVLNKGTTVGASRRPHDRVECSLSAIHMFCGPPLQCSIE